MVHLDVDELRSRRPNWESDRHAAGVEARRLMHQLVRQHLAGGTSVVVSQLFGYDADLDRLAEAARSTGGIRHVEIVLMAEFDDAFARFVERGGDAATALGTDDEMRLGFTELYERVMSGPACRTDAVLVETVPGDTDASFANLLSAIGGEPSTT